MTKSPEFYPHHYNAEVRSIYDADTVTVMIDYGFEEFGIKTLRLARIDAPELTGEERPRGLASRDWLRNLIPVGTKIMVKTEKLKKDHRDKKGKYGRYIADIFYTNAHDELVCVNDYLVDVGAAVYETY
jgi:endonuclease YncB( thermonuclease family)